MEVGNKTPLTKEDADHPMESSNSFLRAFRWFVLGMLGPAQVNSFSKSQTASLVNVFAKDFPRTPDQIDPAMKELCLRFKAFCATKEGQELFGALEFTIASSRIIGGYTAAMMNKCRTMNVSAVPYTHPGHVHFRNVYDAIEVVQSQGQKLFDHIYRGEMRSAVLPLWRYAFKGRATDDLAEATTTGMMTEAEWDTAETIVTCWPNPVTGDPETPLSEASTGSHNMTEGGLSPNTTSESVAGTSVASSGEAKREPNEWMLLYRQKLGQMDSLLSVRSHHTQARDKDDVGVSTKGIGGCEGHDECVRKGCSI